MGIGGVVAACSAYNRKVVGSNPGSALLIPEVNVVDFNSLISLRILQVINMCMSACCMVNLTKICLKFCI